MKRIIFIFLLSFKFSFSVTIPTQYGGQVISLNEFQQYTDYCFYTKNFILDSVYGLSYNQLDYNYRLYDMQNGEIVLGFGEFILHCFTEQSAINVYGNTSVMNGKYQSTLKRGRTDRCLGLDWFDGFYNIYGCIPDTGEWYVIPDSVGGSSNDSSGTYDCYNPDTDNFYAGSSYLNLVISKVKIFGVEYEDNYYYRTFACTENDETVSINPTLTQLKTGLTTSRTSTNIGSSGGSTGGSTGGGSTTPDNSEITTKLNAIQTDLESIKTQNSTSQSQFLGKIADVENSILLQNEQIAVSKAVLESKLDTIQSKTQLLENEIKAKIEVEKENLKTELIADNELKTNEIKEKINLLENELTNLNTETNNNIKSLNDSISNYQSSDTDSKNEILTRLSGLESGINNTNQSLSNIENSLSNTDGTGNNEELVGALNTGLDKIDETLKNSLIDENSKPYLKSINEHMLNQISPIEDVIQTESEINSFIGSELAFAINKYNNLFGTGYCSSPSNITLSLMGNTYTLIDYSVLNPYIDLIRSIFLTLAYLIGLFLFLRVK